MKRRPGLKGGIELGIYIHYHRNHYEKMPQAVTETMIKNQAILNYKNAKMKVKTIENDWPEQLVQGIYQNLGKDPIAANAKGIESLLRTAQENKSMEGFSQISSYKRIQTQINKLNEYITRLNNFADAANAIMPLADKSVQKGLGNAAIGIRVTQELKKLKDHLNDLEKLTENPEKIRTSINAALSYQISGLLSDIIGGLNELIGAEIAVNRVYEIAKSLGATVTREETGGQRQTTKEGVKSDTNVKISLGKESYEIGISSKAWSKKLQPHFMRSYGSISMLDALKGIPEHTENWMFNNIIHTIGYKAGQTQAITLRYLAQKHMINLVGKDVLVIQYTDGFKMIDDFYLDVLNETDKWGLGLDYSSNALKNEWIGYSPNKEAAQFRSDTLATLIYSLRSRLIYY